MYNVREWRHIFKLDPNKPIDDHTLEQICESGTDAIIVGGTDGVTIDNVLNLMSSIRRYTVPCVLEVSNIESVTPGFDYYFIPTVLNSPDPEWIVGLHQQALKEYGDVMNWDEVMTEGYCILNPECKAAKLTNAKTDLSEDDVIAYARLSEKVFKLPIFYLEYSGTYGDVQLVKKISATLEEAQLFYGGGITSIEKAKEMAEHADTIVVGNFIYDNLEEALKTVQVAKK
ncbi:MAG: heptaprenylglyceryl phosphate synthase [Bacillaceae bacterium]|nr:heptaprenylglyceryl phosphate synthase [Bacillaceae bacterium]